MLQTGLVLTASHHLILLDIQGCIWENIPRKHQGVYFKKSTDMQGWWVASQYGPNERVKRED